MTSPIGKISLELPSSFGMNGTDFGPGGARNVIESERTIRLAKWNSIYGCTRYDDRSYDWDGNYVGAGTWAQYASPQMASSATPGFVPLSNRRPSNPYRLGKLIVDKFTAFIFSGDCPSLHCIGDQDTEDFAAALIQVADLPTKIIQARSIGGSCGTVGLSWAIKDGQPIVRVHNGQYLHVHEWADRDELIPAVVSEIYKYADYIWDPEKECVVQKYYWHRRCWTRVADVVFTPIEVEGGDDPDWTNSIDEEMSDIHGDGFCHFIWIQNKPSQEIDGFPDYFGVEEQLGELDMLNSLMSKGLRKNLDPTLVLKMPGGQYARAAVQKGSDHAIVLDSISNSDASYLELQGSSINVGMDKLKLDTQHILDVVQCVLHDPNEIGAQGLSATAIRLLLGPMIDACTLFRAQYGRGFKRLLEQMILTIQSKTNKEQKIVMPDGTSQKVTARVDLPPREKEVNDVNPDPDGKDTSFEEHNPGNGQWFSVVWKPFVQDTSQDKQQMIQGMGMAVQLGILSKASAVEEICQTLGRDPEQELKRISQDQKTQQAQQAQMMPGVGGPVGGPGGMPGGAQPRAPKVGGGGGAMGAGTPAIPKPPSAPKAPGGGPSGV